VVDVATAAATAAFWSAARAPIPSPASVERTPVAKAGQPVAGGQRFQRVFARFWSVMSRKVSTTAMSLLRPRTGYRTGVDRQIQLIAEFWHHAPVFRRKSRHRHRGWWLGIKLAQFVGQVHQIGRQ